ncbi:hypothetical protein [Aquabacterium sp.]|uniref:hypothetical protein n=1 Tax=Aquabacterium sp. TaxID=1872578 RepID=UPI003784A970
MGQFTQQVAGTAGSHMQQTKRFPIVTYVQRAETRRQVEERVRNASPDQKARIVALQERARLGRLAQVALKAVRDVVRAQRDA